MITDTFTLVGRCLRLARRDADALLMAIALPIMLMLLFVYLFGGAIHTGTAYVTYVVPGVLALCVGFGAAGTAVMVTKDLGSGIADRFRSLDVGATSLLTGHVVASLARNAVATVLVVAVALAIGFRPRAGLVQWLAAAAVLGLFVLALSWVSAAFGVLTRSTDAAGGFGFFLSFLAYPSSAFVPLDDMPTWLQAFARNQPVTRTVEAVRALLLDRPVGTHVVASLAWSLGIVVIAMTGAALAYRRRTA